MLRPKGVDMHYEVELALILGKQVKDLKADDHKGAIDAIEGSSHLLGGHHPPSCSHTY